MWFAHRGGPQALYATLYRKNNSEPFLCPGDGIFFNHTRSVVTGDVNRVTDGYAYFSMAAPYSMLPGAVPAQDYAGPQLEHAALLGFRFKYAKGELKFYVGEKSTSFAKKIEDIGLCAVP